MNVYEHLIRNCETGELRALWSSLPQREGFSVIDPNLPNAESWTVVKELRVVQL